MRRDQPMRQEEAEAASALLKRAPLLAAMRTGTVTRRALQERFDLARTTAYRATVDLEERGLIERTGDGYELTSTGRAVVDSSGRYLESLAATERLRPLLEHVDEPDLLGSLHVLDDAEVMVADADEPFRLIDWWTEQSAVVDRLRILTVSTGRRKGFETIAGRVDAGADVEVVFSPNALEGAHRVAPDLLDQFVRREPPPAYVHREIPFNLAIFDDTVAVVGTDADTGIPAVYVVSDETDAREWAERFYRRYRRESEPVTASDLHPLRDDSNVAN